MNIYFTKQTKQNGGNFFNHKMWLDIITSFFILLLPPFVYICLFIPHMHAVTKYLFLVWVWVNIYWEMTQLNDRNAHAFASFLFPILNNIRCKLPQQSFISPDGRQMKVAGSHHIALLFAHMCLPFHLTSALASQQLQLLQICLSKWIRESSNSPWVIGYPEFHFEGEPNVYFHWQEWHGFRMCPFATTFDFLWAEHIWSQMCLNPSSQTT